MRGALRDGLHRFRVALLAFLLLLVLAPTISTASTPVAHDLFTIDRSRVDRRIDRLDVTTLLTTPPMALVDPLRADASRRLATVRRPLFFLWIALQIGGMLWLWRSGASVALRRILTNTLRHRLLVRASYAFLLVVLINLCTLPAEFIGHHLLTRLGLFHAPVSLWLGQCALSSVIEGAVFAALIVVVFALVDTTRLWYLWACGIVLALSLGLTLLDPIGIAPLFHHLTPLAPQSVTAQSARRLFARAGLTPIPVLVSDVSTTSEVGDAGAFGIGPTRRLIIGDTLLHHETPGEIRFVMAHELGHFVHHDQLRLMLVCTFLVLIAAAGSVLVADRIRMRADEDALSRLPLLLALLGVWALVVLPIGNAASRHAEAEADAFARDLTHDPASGVRLFVRFADEGFLPVCPPKPVVLYFYDHPSIGNRIAALTGRVNPCESSVGIHGDGQ